MEKSGVLILLESGEVEGKISTERQDKAKEKRGQSEEGNKAKVGERQWTTKGSDQRERVMFNGKLMKWNGEVGLTIVGEAKCEKSGGGQK